MYRHRACGVCTQMPEEIIRSYLVDPLLYGDSSFCCGCGIYVYGDELEWTETGERLVDYSARLRRDYLRDTLRIALPPASTGGLIVTPAVAKGLRAAAERYNVGPDYYLAVSVSREASELKYVANLVLGRDPKTETAVVTGGMAVIVPNEQVEFFKGVVVDYRPEGNGFSCGRYRTEPGKPDEGW